MKHTRTWLILLLVSSLYSFAQAQDPMETIFLDETVVAAEGSAEENFATPFAVSLLDGEAVVLERQVRSLPEVLEDQPSVMVQRTAHGQGSPYIRGFTAFRTLMLVDGVRLNNSVFREGPNQYWNTVDPLSLKQYELVRGPGSVLYGSDAIGGTLAVSTYNRDLAPESGLLARYSTAEESFIVRPYVGQYIGDNLRFEGGLSYKDFGDLEGGKDVGTQSGTGYDELDGDARLAWELDDGRTILFSFQTVNQNEVPRTHKTIDGISWKGTTIGSELQRDLDQHRHLGTLQYHGHDVRAGLSYTRMSEEQDRIRGNGRRDVQGFDVDTIGGFLQRRIDTGNDHEWIVGADVYYDDVTSFRTDCNADGSLRGERIQGAVGDDSTYLSAGAFVQDSFQATEQLKLTLGARASYFQADIGEYENPNTGDADSFDEDFSALAGSARGVYSVCDQFNVFGGVSTGFRAPNLSDLSRLDSARSNEIETPSPGLDPEEYISYEIGVKGRSDRLSGSLAYYYTDISDMIVRTPTGNEIDGELEVTKRNGGDGFVHGVELEAGYDFGGGFSSRGFVAWQRGEVDTFPTSDPVSVREPMSRLLPTTASGTLRYEDGPGWVEAVVTGAEKADRLSSRDKGDTQRIPEGGTPSYVAGTLRGGWEFTDSLAVSLAVENITDGDYRIHGSGLNEAGRNFIATVNLRF